MVAQNIGFANGDPRNAEGSAFGVRFRPEAAGAMLAFGAAYRERWGTDPGISEGMRDVERQFFYWDRFVNRKPGWTVAAAPVFKNGEWHGTSMHGWGLGSDFKWPLNARTEQHAWAAEHAPEFGWEWTGKDFDELWHFDYTGVNVTAAQRAAYIEAGLRGSLTSPAAAVLLT